MQENYISCTGIVLRTTPLKERSCVFSLFTKELGRISCFAHGLSSKNLSKRMLTTPLSYGTYQLRKKGSNLLLIDGSAHQLIPKKEFVNITLSATLLRYISRTQLEEKPSPALFDLLIHYLKKCLTTRNATALHASFIIKLMKHEGMYYETQAIPHMSHEENMVASYLCKERSFEILESAEVDDTLIEKLSCLI